MNVNVAELKLTQIWWRCCLLVYYLIFLPMVMHMHMKLMNTFGNWLIQV